MVIDQSYEEIAFESMSSEFKHDEELKAQKQAATKKKMDRRVSVFMSKDNPIFTSTLSKTMLDNVGAD